MCCVPSPLLVSACVPCVDCVQGGVPEPESGCNIEALRSAVDRWSEIQERQELQSLTVLASDIHCFCKSQLCACARACVCVCVCVCLLSALSFGPDYVATITVYTYYYKQFNQHRRPVWGNIFLSECVGWCVV